MYLNVDVEVEKNRMHFRILSVNTQSDASFWFNEELLVWTFKLKLSDFILFYFWKFVEDVIEYNMIYRVH